jgi:hypothetical protein
MVQLIQSLLFISPAFRHYFRIPQRPPGYEDFAASSVVGLLKDRIKMFKEGLRDLEAARAKSAESQTPVKHAGPIYKYEVKKGPADARARKAGKVEKLK